MFSQKRARALNLDGSRMFNCSDFPWKSNPEDFGPTYAEELIRNTTAF